MKFKLSTIALAGLCAASGAAQAAIEFYPTSPERPTSEMVFVAYDPVNQVTYVRDLGTMVSEFNFSQGYNPSGTTLEGFDTFLGMVDAGVTRWGIVASDSSAPVSTYYTAAQFVSGGNPNAVRINSINSRMMQFFNVHNTFQSVVGNHSSVADGWSIETTFGSYGQGTALFSPEHNLGGTFAASALLNTELSFYAFTNPRFSGSTRTRLGTYGGPPNALELGDTFNYNPRFAVVGNELVFLSPVPEPGTYALMLAGLVTLGAVARRRRA